MRSATISFFRVVAREGEMLADADSIDEVTEILRTTPAGRYHIDEISANPLPPGHTARRWGFEIRQPNGRVVLESDPWET